MANFDPKTKIERLVLKHPALASIFKEAATTVDDQLTVEEFCFVNGIDFMDFFRRLDEAVAAAEQRDQEQRREVCQADRNMVAQRQSGRKGRCYYEAPIGAD